MLAKFASAVVTGLSQRSVGVKAPRTVHELKLCDKTGEYKLTLDGKLDVSKLELTGKYDIDCEIVGSLWGTYGNQQLEIVKFAAKAV